ncbi:hypothetical protein AB1Y20_010770 [Prymnesium parvum]|uniref:RRM domain-containing protein n=1 Tax=Prymnesium parvum TaxID=97485 RepID=A0AB34IRP7_PRYPA
MAAHEEQPTVPYPYTEYHADPYAHAAAGAYPPPAPACAHTPEEPPPPHSDAAALASARAEIAALKAEIAALKAAAAGASCSSTALLPPPQFYPPHYNAYPPYPPAQYASPSPWGYAPPTPGAAPPARPPPPTLAINAENKRGPKGANLAVFCIPNSYYDQQVYDLAKPYGNVVFCQVACHRDTGASRGYAFVSYETVEEAERAIAALHNYIVENRALRVEVARADRESKPY